jgi:hypothetical protein
MRYCERRPVSQPQVWLRITKELHDPRVRDATIKYTFAWTDKQPLLAALNAEKLRSQRAAQLCSRQSLKPCESISPTELRFAVVTRLATGPTQRSLMQPSIQVSIKLCGLIQQSASSAQTR